MCTLIKSTIAQAQPIILHLRLPETKETTAQKSTTKFKISFLTTTSTSQYTYSVSAFSVPSNRQGNYSIDIVMKGIMVQLSVKKNHKSQITAVSSGKPSAWNYENASYASLTVTNLFDDTGSTAPADAGTNRTVATGTNELVKFFRYKESVVITPAVSNSNAYIKRYHTFGTSYTTPTSSNNSKTTVTEAITISSSSTSYNSAR